MRCGVANDVQPLRIPIRYDSKRAVGLDRIRNINLLAIHLSRQGSPCKALANVFRDIVYCYRLAKLPNRAIRKCDINHGPLRKRNLPRLFASGHAEGGQKNGRREWERTTDHYHVKVVLYH